MNKFVFFFILILSVSCFGQDQNKELVSLENEFKKSSSELSELKTRNAEIQIEISNMRRTYTNEYPPLIEKQKLFEENKKKINELENNILDVKSRIQTLQDEIFLKSLPNNQIELLKILIMQNRQIIQLLSKEKN